MANIQYFKRFQIYNFCFSFFFFFPKKNSIKSCPTYKFFELKNSPRIIYIYIHIYHSLSILNHHSPTNRSIVMHSSRKKKKKNSRKQPSPPTTISLLPRDSDIPLSIVGSILGFAIVEVKLRRRVEETRRVRVRKSGEVRSHDNRRESPPGGPLITIQFIRVISVAERNTVRRGKSITTPALFCPLPFPPGGLSPNRKWSEYPSGSFIK